MKKIILSLVFILFSLALVIAEDNIPNSEDNSASSEEITQSNPSASDTTSSPVDSSQVAQTESPTNSPENPQGESTDEIVSEEKVELKAKPGIAPDNPVYFVKDIYQRMTVGNNPQRALDYKEQKIAEAELMVEKGKPDQAEKVLKRALEYSEIIKKEANPKMKDKVQESVAAVENSIEGMEEKTKGSEWIDVREKFDETLKKEKEINTAAELTAKINELCASLAQLDPLQYADTCKSKEDSPKWMKEQDKEISAEQEEQAKVFFEKLSLCFESPENCDCKGMGVQKFEDFCLEKSKIALKCKQGDENACKETQSGADPSDLLPGYLISVLNQVQEKYAKAQYSMYMPEECVQQGAKEEDCMKIMFEKTAPQECLDKGITGKTKEDEIKCRQLMFEKNAPQECLDAGISLDDSDASRKCAKIMFLQRAPQECLDVGITGEGRDDEKKCKQLIVSNTDALGQKPALEGGAYSKQKFNRDCNKVQDSNEKVKCYEEFYNNAQVQFSEDFIQREIKDTNTGEIITSEEENVRKQCKNKGMDTILEYENGKRIIICVEKGQTGGSGGRCQSQDETEKLKEDCKSRGQEANVETRGGCPWVICVGGDFRGDFSSTVGRTYAPGTGPNQPQQTQNQQTQNIIDQSSQNTGGIKCPDNTCDSYEKMNPWACPEDCGGTRQPGNYPQQQPGAQPPQNIIDQPQQPNQQNQENFCSGQAPSCAPNGAPFCQNGNWICPTAPQQQPTEQQSPVQQQPIEQQSPVQPAPEQQPQQPVPETSVAPPVVETSSTPLTGATITGRIIASDYGDENSRSGDSFLDYWFGR